MKTYRIGFSIPIEKEEWTDVGIYIYAVNFDDALEIAKRIAKSHNATLNFIIEELQ